MRREGRVSPKPPVELRDLDLIARVLGRDDRHAFGELVRRHQSAVRAFLRRLTNSQHALADDLAQETFIQAYRDLAKFRGTAPFHSWLFGIAYNRFRQHRRREQPTETWAGDVTLAHATGGGESTEPGHADAVALRHDLANAMNRLSDDERSAIHLCYDAGLSHDEAAQALGWPLGTLKSHVLRGKEKLKTYLRAWEPA
jgi:RNA polymerase sigma-70 factor (ECF subfamily)